MADFFSDSDGEKAVEDLLSQAMDAAVLDQVAAINCAGFTDSGLPSHLETRFQRLKSFPSSAPKPPASSLSSKSFNLSQTPPQFKNRASANELKKPDSGERAPTTCSTKCPKEENLTPDEGESPSSPLEENPRGKMEKMGRRGRKPAPSSSSSSSSGRSVSPPVKTGCFLCSPKKVHRKKDKENRGLDLGLDWGKNDELLSGFSVSSRRKIMKKAMEEEERVCREAEKIAKWAKQASARMDISGFEDDQVSDDENSRFH